MGANESRPGSFVKIHGRHRTTENDLERLHFGFKQLSPKDRRSDAIVVAEDGVESGRGADSGSGDVEKDAEVSVLDNGSKDGEERGEELVSKEGGRGEVTGSDDVDKDEGSKDGEEREVVMVRSEESKEGSEKEKEVVWVEKLEMSCYPQRPNVKDCTFYLQTGTCAYKRNCMFNHPHDRRNDQIVSENAMKGKGKEKAPESVEQQKCKNISKNAEKGMGKKKASELVEQHKCKNVSENATRHRGKKNVPESAEQHKCKNVSENATRRRGKKKDPESAVQQKCKNVSENSTRRRGKKKVSESAVQQKCKYYLSPDDCPSGSSCKFRHQVEGYRSETVQLNFMGLPIRRGVEKCSYYMRTGSCKFSINCRYHHPEPTEVGGSDSFPDALQTYVSQVPTTQNLQLHLQGNDYEGRSISEQYSKFGRTCIYDHSDLNFLD